MIKKSFVLLLCILLLFGFSSGKCLAREKSISKLKASSPKDAELASRKKRSKALAHYMMGIIYDNKGQVKLAINEYKKSLKLHPQSTLARLRLGIDYLVSREDEKAVKEFELAKKIDPKNSEARFLIALLYVSSGELEEAKKEYEEI